jgi:hypothetical protein
VRAAADEDGKAAAIAQLATADGHERLLVFVRFVAAAERLFARLCDALGGRARVGLAAGGAARATGLGPTTLDDLVTRFSPKISEEPPPAHETLQVLVATDCLSEAVNLQSCRRVVLADLSYTPLVLEQRIGRVLRPGGEHAEVDVYVPRPSNWNDSLGMRARLVLRANTAAEAGLGFQWNASQAPSPLEALDQYERWALALPHPKGGTSWRPRATAIGSEDAAWVWFRVLDGANERFSLVRVTEGGVEDRLPELMPDLIELSESGETVALGAAGDTLDAAAEAWGQSLAARLNAARLAPVPVRLDAPAWLLWRRAVDESSLDRAQLLELRARLVREHPRGVSARLERLWNEAPPLARLLRELSRLDLPTRTPMARVEIVATLRVSCTSRRR